MSEAEANEFRKKEGKIRRLNETDKNKIQSLESRKRRNQLQTKSKMLSEHFYNQG